MKRYLFCALLILCACGREQNFGKSEVLFSKKIAVTGSHIIRNLSDPTVIELMDSLVIVSNYKAEPLIEIYSLSGKSIKKFLSIGKGPYEILATGDIQAVKGRNMFFINDLFTKKILAFNIDSVLSATNNPRGSIYYALSEEKKSEYLFDKLLISNNGIVAESRSPRGRLLLFDSLGRAIDYYLKYPDKKNVNAKLSDMGNARIYASAIVSNPEMTKLAMATYSADMLNILDIRKNSLDSLWSHVDSYPNGIEVMPMGDELVPVHTAESITGYLDIAASGKYVYALYSGKDGSNSDYAYGNIVRVVSWDGREAFELVLDKPLRRLTVSNDNKTLYGISIDEYASPSVAKFNLNL